MTLPDGSQYSFTDAGGSHLNGNLTSIDGTGFSYDAANKRQDLSFDADGDQLQTVTGSALVWDDVGRLVSAGSDTYQYSMGGRRHVRVDAAGHKTFYIFDGDSVLGEITSGGTVKAVYTWGAGGLVSERLPQQNTTRWYHFGPQGETRLLTDPTGQVRDTYAYSAYGQPLASTGSDPNPFRCRGDGGPDSRMD